MIIFNLPSPNNPDQFYWPHRCNDGFEECEWGDDEKNTECDEDFSGTLKPTTVSK